MVGDLLDNPKKYGRAPYGLVVVHGGPGAAGGMAPLARALSADGGVLEPFQTAASLTGQIEELRECLLGHADLPAILIGSSWGAMLGFVFAAHYPGLVRKLILIGSGAYEEKYAANITKTRLNRLSEEEREEALSLMETLNDPAIEDKNAPMAQLGKLVSKADSYDPLSNDSEQLECQYNIYQNVWEQAKELRSSGKLLELGKGIQCPVVVIHGDYDPHLFEGIKAPLSRVLKDLQLILLEKCGHRPWIERKARDRLYNILEKELVL